MEFRLTSTELDELRQGLTIIVRKGDRFAEIDGLWLNENEYDELEGEGGAVDIDLQLNNSDDWTPCVLTSDDIG